MNIRFLFALLSLVMALTASASVEFTGLTRELYDTVPERSTGINHIYVIYDTNGVGMTYTADTDNPVTWYTFDQSTIGSPQEITVEHDGRLTTLNQVLPNVGYIIEEGTSRLYLWLVDYSDYRFSLNSVNVASDGDCGSTTLNIDGFGPEIPYCTLTGVRKVINRDIKIKYNNLVWSLDEGEGEEEIEPEWVERPMTDSLASLRPAVALPAPTTNTTFTVCGDRFLRFWGEEVCVESNEYYTAAIDVRCVITQTSEKHDNEIKTGSEGTLGGSAPCTITFAAYCTDAVMHREWQMSNDYNFSTLDLRLNQEVVAPLFEDAGTTYWRFYATNADGTCEYYSDIYTVSIGESELICPNVFTPGSSEGVNDIWKVSYRSIIDFHCTIFNRWGNVITELKHPSEGWDGKYKGKLVPAGVYFYVINAKGSDGKNYKLSGDINIIRYKRVDHGGGDDPVVSHE